MINRSRITGLELTGLEDKKKKNTAFLKRLDCCIF